MKQDIKSTLNAPVNVSVISINGHQLILSSNEQHLLVPKVKNVQLSVMHSFGASNPSIEAFMVETVRSAKKIIFKKLRRHNYRRLKSCRSIYSRLKITHHKGVIVSGTEKSSR